MSFYTNKDSVFYTDLSDLLLLLSIGLTNPDRELAAGLTDNSYFSDLAACIDGVCLNTNVAGADAVVEAFAPAKTLQNAATRAYKNKDTEEIYHSINQEYSRLFISPKNELIPIYESLLVHQGEKVSMFINATCMHAEQTYRHNNFSFEEKSKVPGDHMAIELRYLAYLFAAYVNAVQNANDTSCKAVEAAVADFTKQHVQRWIGPFAEQVRVNTQNPFYLQIAATLDLVKAILL